MPGVTPTPARARMPRAQRKALMVQAARRLFSERGFKGTSMEDVADASGITKPLVYQYFGSKESLWDVSVEAVRAQLFDGIEQTVAAVSVDQQLRAFAELYFDHLDAHRGAWWMLYAGASPAAADAMRERNAAVIGPMLARALDATGRERDPQALEVLAHALVGAGEQVGRWWIARPEVDKQTAVACFLDVAQGAIGGVFRGLAPR